MAASNFPYWCENWNVIKLEEEKIRNGDESCEARCIAMKREDRPEELNT
jgi:hypothetical protein